MVEDAGPPPPPGPPAGWYPDPSQPHTQRYWDGATWTEQRAPLTTAPGQRPSGAFPAALALAIVGAAIAVVGVFLPRVEATDTFARIAENTLIQSGDGLIVIGLAVAGALVAYVRRERPGKQLLLVVLGAALIALAIYDGTGERLHLVGANTDDLDLMSALDAKVGTQGEPGVGIWAVGVGGGLLALGGLVGRPQPD